MTISPHELIIAHDAETASFRQLLSAKEGALRASQTALETAEKTVQVAQEALALTTTQLDSERAEKLALEADLKGKITLLEAQIAKKEEELQAAIKSDEHELTGAETRAHLYEEEAKGLKKQLQVAESANKTAKARIRELRQAHQEEVYGLWDREDAALKTAQQAYEAKLAQAKRNFEVELENQKQPPQPSPAWPPDRIIPRRF